MYDNTASCVASKETAHNQPSSVEEQSEPISVRRPCSSPTAAEVPATVITNKGYKRKRQVSESEADEVVISTATDKRDKRRKQNSETQDSPAPSN